MSKRSWFSRLFRFPPSARRAQAVGNDSTQAGIAGGSHAAQHVYRHHNTTNSGAGSLKQAILEANSLVGLDTIVFFRIGNGPGRR